MSQKRNRKPALALEVGCVIGAAGIADRRTIPALVADEENQLCAVMDKVEAAAKAVGEVIPEMKGKMTGMSFRIPSADVSVVDLTARLKSPASYYDVCAAMENAAQNSMKGIITCTRDQVVSSDLTGFSETCIFDETAGIMLDDNFVKLIAWYDNEYGYSANTVNLLEYMDEMDHK